MKKGQAASAAEQLLERSGRVPDLMRGRPPPPATGVNIMAKGAIVRGCQPGTQRLDRVGLAGKENDHFI